MNAVQCRMARAALQIGVRELAELAQVAPGTVARMEAGVELKPRTVDALRRAFEAKGIEFIDGNAPGLKVHSKRGRILRPQK